MKTRRRQKHAGFSLLEILVVMAIFVVIASMSVPLLLRSFKGQNLKTAADVVRARFAEARVRAMDTGDIYAFFYTPQGGDYFIAPMVLGFRSQTSGEQGAINYEKLDNEIIFGAGETIMDARGTQESEKAEIQIDSMKPILFYPDGTSQDATLVLQNKFDGVIQVNLRGLTGTSSATRLYSTEELQ